MNVLRAALLAYALGGIAAGAPDGVAASPDRPGDGMSDSPDFVDAPPVRPADPAMAASSGATPISPVDVVVFDGGSADLIASARTQIATAARWLRAHPSYRIVLEAHTDASGPLPANEDLATRRAQSVRDALEHEGIASDRIVLMIFGEGEATRVDDPVERRVVLTACTRPIHEIVRETIDHRAVMTAVWTDHGTLREERRAPTVEPRRRL